MTTAFSTRRPAAAGTAPSRPATPGRSLVTLIALVLAAAVAPPASAATAALQLRESVLYTSYEGGFATAFENGSAGSLAAVTSRLPTALSLADRIPISDTYLSFEIEWFAQWNLVQDYTVDPVARSFGGRGAMELELGGEVTGPDCNPCLPSLTMAGYNQQALEFRLDTDTRYSFSSTTTLDQWIDLLRWDATSQRWDPLWDGIDDTQGVSFSSNGHLPAGRYRVQNNQGSVHANSNQQVLSRDNAWEWTLTLPDASVTADPRPLPEPGTWALMLAGLGASIGIARRRRKAPTAAARLHAVTAGAAANLAARRS